MWNSEYSIMGYESKREQNIIILFYTYKYRKHDQFDSFFDSDFIVVEALSNHAFQVL